ncbi:MAG: hypothetical protein JWR52_742 [Marmoricola sp.]|nr:hypothetical protein [Marmoricola sp.]
MRIEHVETPVGQARIDWFDSTEPPRTILVMGHGTATGVEAGDLQAIATALPRHQVTVALITQPYRLALSTGQQGRRASDEPSLDAAWRAVWTKVTRPGTQMIAGGRSAGSQVACRTANELGADAVIALSYPLLGPGSARELLATGLPMLVVQGGLDPYGRPDQFPPLPQTTNLIEIPQEGHMFHTPALVAEAVVNWLEHLPGPTSQY